MKACYVQGVAYGTCLAERLLWRCSTAKCGTDGEMRKIVQPKAGVVKSYVSAANGGGSHQSRRDIRRPSRESRYQQYRVA